MLPDENLQVVTWLAESNNKNQMRPAAFSGVSMGSFPRQQLVIEPTYTTVSFLCQLKVHVLCNYIASVTATSERTKDDSYCLVELCQELMWNGLNLFLRCLSPAITMQKVQFWHSSDLSPLMFKSCWLIFLLVYVDRLWKILVATTNGMCTCKPQFLNTKFAN